MKVDALLLVYTILKIFALYQLKIGKRILFVLSLGLLSYFFMYVTKTYIFGATPYIFQTFSIQPYVLFNKALVSNLFPILTDISTEITLKKFQGEHKDDFLLSYVYRMITFPFIALFFEILIIFITLLLTFYILE